MGYHRDPKGRTYHGLITEGLLEKGVVSPPAEAGRMGGIWRSWDADRLLERIA